MVAIVSLIYGYQRLAAVGDEIEAARKLPVAAVQGNIDIDLKWNPSLVKQNLEKHKNLTRQLDAVPLVIWPESAIEVWLPDQLQYLPDDLMPPLPSNHTLSSAQKASAASPELRTLRRSIRHFSRMHLVGSWEDITSRYCSRLASICHLPNYYRFATGNAVCRRFYRGQRSGRVFEMPGGIRIGALICYEDLMPDLSRDFVKGTGANLLVNLTNDAWYGKSVGPWQHARLAQSRAIETRRSLLRVTNTGSDFTGQCQRRTSGIFADVCAGGAKSRGGYLGRSDLLCSLWRLVRVGHDHHYRSDCSFPSEESHNR